MGHYRHYDGPDLSRSLQAKGFTIEKRLSQFIRFWQCYHYFYVTFRVGEAVIRKVLASNYSVYNSWLYRKLAERILRYLASRYRDDDVQSTFILCRKREPSESAMQ